MACIQPQRWQIEPTVVCPSLDHERAPRWESLPGEPAPREPAPALDRSATRKLAFHGDGGTLLWLLIVNALLTVLTLGLYRFWGKVRTRRYFFGHLELDGDAFAFHGTGDELFRSSLKIGSIFFAFGALLSLVEVVFGKGSAVSRLAPLLIHPLLLFIAPYAMVGARRYLLSRTSWRGVRFSFRGSGRELIWPFVKGLLLSAVTLGFYLPYFKNAMQSFFMNQTYYGNRRFQYDGSGDDLFGPYVRAFFLGLGTLGMYWFWFFAERERYYAARTSLGGLRFRSSVTGGKLLGLLVTNCLLVIFTAGLGIPWALCRTMRFRCDNLLLEGPSDLGDIEEDLQDATATGEQLADALNIDAGLGAWGF